MAPCWTGEIFDVAPNGALLLRLRNCDGPQRRLDVECLIWVTTIVNYGAKIWREYVLH